MSENLLVREHENTSPEQVKTLPGHFPLDWKTQEVKFGGGKFAHTLRRPTTEELLARDAEIQLAIDMGKDGSYKLPDPTADEDLNARYYDLVKLDAQGYPTEEIPTSHKERAFLGLYKHEIYVDDDEDASLFDEEVTVFEEVGGDPPAFTISHVFRQPTEAELRLYRKKIENGQVKPGKRGRQQYVTRSNLRTAMDFYDKWIIRIDGATVDGELFYNYKSGNFVDAVDPLIKRMIVKEFADKLLEALQD